LLHLGPLVALRVLFGIDHAADPALEQQHAGHAESADAVRAAPRARRQRLRARPHSRDGGGGKWRGPGAPVEAHDGNVDAVDAHGDDAVLGRHGGSSGPVKDALCLSLLLQSVCARPELCSPVCSAVFTGVSRQFALPIGARAQRGLEQLERLSRKLHSRVASLR
jgi:hypothetical protein